MADVFLSYKRDDEAKARDLVNALRSRGLAVWWDQDIPPGAPWEATIERALHDAKAVIVGWSPSSVESEYVRSEARWARDQGRLLQVFLKTCKPPLFFGERQIVDLSDWLGDPRDGRIGQVCEAVRLIESTPHPPPPPQEPDHAPPQPEARPGPPLPPPIADRSREWVNPEAMNTWKSLPRMVRVGLTVAIVIISINAFRWIGRAPPSPSSPASSSRLNGRIEVVGFETRSPEPDVKRLSSDLGDAVVRGLFRSSVDVATAGSAAAARSEFKITGSVQRRGPDYAVDATVLHRRSGMVLLSTQYIRPAASPEGFADQVGASLSAAIACALEERKDAEDSDDAKDPSALAVLMKACAAKAPPAPAPPPPLPPQSAAPASR